MISALEQYAALRRVEFDCPFRDVPEVSSESTMSEAEKRYHESNQWGR